MRRDIRSLFMDGDLTFAMLSHWRHKRCADSLIEGEDTEEGLLGTILSSILGFVVLVLLLQVCVREQIHMNNPFMAIAVALMLVMTTVSVGLAVSYLQWKKKGYQHTELIEACAVVHDLLRIMFRYCLKDIDRIDGLDLEGERTLTPVASHSHENMKKIFHHLLYERTDLIAENTERTYKALWSFGFTEESWEDYVNKPKKSKPAKVEETPKAD